MRFIPTYIHGILDYATGLFLIAAPWLPGFADAGIPKMVMIAVGIINILYSLLTNYELGILRIIRMPLHLWLDFISGALLAASPWLLGFHRKIWAPHLAMGIFEMSAALLSRKTTGRLVG